MSLSRNKYSEMTHDYQIFRLSTSFSLRFSVNFREDRLAF